MNPAPTEHDAEFAYIAPGSNYTRYRFKKHEFGARYYGDLSPSVFRPGDIIKVKTRHGSLHTRVIREVIHRQQYGRSVGYKIATVVRLENDPNITARAVRNRERRAGNTDGDDINDKILQELDRQEAAC